MKSDSHVQGNVEDSLAGVVNERAVIRIAEISRREPLAEVFRVSEFHRNDELSSLVDVTPLAGISDQADAVSYLTDIDSGDPFGKIVDNVELRRNYFLSVRIDEYFLFAASDQGQAFPKFIGTVELKGNLDLSGAIDEAPLAVFLNRKQRLRPGLLSEGS